MRNKGFSNIYDFRGEFRTATRKHNLYVWDKMANDIRKALKETLGILEKSRKRRWENQEVLDLWVKILAVE